MLAVTAAICLWMLTIDRYPGRLGDALFWTVGFTGLGIIWLVGIYIGFWIMFALLHKPAPFKTALFKFFAYWRYMLVVFLMLLGTLAIGTFHVSTRLAFERSRAEFNEFIAAPQTTVYNEFMPGRKIGLFQVEACAVDNRGGVYLVAYSGMDGISPDTMSYGFCHRPNPEGTPFGAAHYNLLPLGDGWFIFEVSNDWF